MLSYGVRLLVLAAKVSVIGVLWVRDDAYERRQYYGDVATRYLNYRIGGETVQLELIRKDEQTGTRPLQITKKVYICQTTQRTIPRNWALGSFVSRLWGCAGKYGPYLFVKNEYLCYRF